MESSGTLVFDLKIFRIGEVLFFDCCLAFDIEETWEFVHMSIAICHRFTLLASCIGKSLAKTNNPLPV